MSRKASPGVYSSPSAVASYNAVVMAASLIDDPADGLRGVLPLEPEAIVAARQHDWLVLLMHHARLIRRDAHEHSLAQRVDFRRFGVLDPVAVPRQFPQRQYGSRLKVRLVRDRLNRCNHYIAMPPHHLS